MAGVGCLWFGFILASLFVGELCGPKNEINELVAEKARNDFGFFASKNVS
jgi:hypothetical protein